MWPSATVDSVMKQQEINLDFSRRQVMTIVNVTPDSFFAGSRTPDWLDVERRVREAVEAGASVIDVGGYSSRRVPTRCRPRRSGGASIWVSGPCVRSRPICRFRSIRFVRAWPLGRSINTAR